MPKRWHSFHEVRESSCKIDKNKTIFPINYINFTSSKFLLNNKHQS